MDLSKGKACKTIEKTVKIEARVRELPEKNPKK